MAPEQGMKRRCGSGKRAEAKKGAIVYFAEEEGIRRNCSSPLRYAPTGPNE